MYKVGEFRKSIKKAMEEAKSGKDVIIDCYGDKYRLSYVDKHSFGVLPKYGCGCVKESGKALCKAHGRY